MHVDGMQVTWFTALFPYVLMFILLIRGLTLPGSTDGIRYYLYPDFTKLSHSTVSINHTDCEELYPTAKSHKLAI